VGNITRLTMWAAIGLLVAGLFLGLLFLLTGGAHAPSVAPLVPEAVDTIDPSIEQAMAETAGAVVDPESIAPPELIATTEQLQAEYKSRKTEIPEDVAAPLDQDIGLIEGAVADLLAAVAQDPDNESLKKMLIATYRNEVKLLKTALHLSSEPVEDE